MKFLLAEKDNFDNRQAKAHAQFFLRFGAPYLFNYPLVEEEKLDLNKIDPEINDNCPSHIKQDGRVLLTEFELCQPYPGSRKVGVTFRYYQKVGFNCKVFNPRIS